MVERSENHCAPVNFPQFRFTLEGWTVRLLEYASTCARKRVRRRKRARAPCIYKYTRANSHTSTDSRTTTQSRRARRKFKRSVHLHARLFPISRMLSPPFDSYALYVPRRIRRVHKILFPFISPFSCLGRPSVIPSKRCLSPTDNYLIFMNTFYSRDRINIKTYLPFIRLCASSRGY